MGKAAPGRPEVVLVVEDDAIMRIHAVDLVEEAGFEVVEAVNADEAVRILESRPDIRIVFTDIDMPGGMDGVKLAAAVRKRWPPVDIIVTSGFKAPLAADLPEGSVFFAKPYRDRDVAATLRRMVA